MGWADTAAFLGREVKERETVSRSVMSNPLRPRGLKPVRLLHPWDSPGKNTGVGSHFLIKTFGNSLAVQFLPRESQGQRGLVGCHLWGHTESDTTEAT